MYLLGKEIIEVYGKVRKLKKEFENAPADDVIAIIDFEEGSNGFLEISENQWRGKGNISNGEGINFYGNDGSLEISLSGKFNAYFKDGQEIKENYIPDYNKIWKEFHHSFVKSILEDSPIPITGEEATKNLAVILAILKSSEKNRPISLIEDK